MSGVTSLRVPSAAVPVRTRTQSWNIHNCNTEHHERDLGWRRWDISVRYGSLHRGPMVKVDPPWIYNQSGEVKYHIEGEHVIIHTRYLCGFIVTTESFYWCRRSANIHVFGAQRIPRWFAASSALSALFTVEIYISSIHSDIKDYLLVRFLQTHYNRNRKHKLK